MLKVVGLIYVEAFRQPSHPVAIPRGDDDLAHSRLDSRPRAAPGRPRRTALRRRIADIPEAELGCLAHLMRTLQEAGVSEAVTERVSRYILDGSDPDLRRLLHIAEIGAESARTAFGRLGIQPGWNAIDCGCGPIGGLTVLAEMVGPAGRVVGVDISPATVQRAQAAVAALDLRNVEAVAGDLHKLDAAVLGGPFDLAFSRFFLMHQHDPVRTLRHIAGLVRPGGWIVAHEPLSSPAPVAHPQLDALTGYWDLFHEVLHRAGVPAGAVENLPLYAREAGLEVVALRGGFTIGDGFDLHAATLTAARERAVHLGIEAERIDDLVRQIQAAGATREWVSSAFVLDLTLRRPTAA